VKLGLPLLSRLLSPPPEVGLTPADVVHRENKWRLLRYRPPAGSPGPRFATPVLLVPSLINRHYVLDLRPGRSFVEYLVGAGHDVFIIDWGTPADEDRWLSLDDICLGYIGRALRVATRLSGRPRAHLLGYCLGGTLATIHAAVHPERVASLLALAAPIDFHDDGLLSTWTRTKSFDVDALVEGTGNVPWPLMQAAFRLLRPTLPFSKAVSMVDRAWDDEFLDGFFAIERWGNDNVSFPGEAYRRWIADLYQENALVNGTLTMRGHPVRLESIACPVLAVSFEDDHIVPSSSAVVLTERVSSSDREHVARRGGHVGAVVSRAASRDLWPRMAGFWQRLDRAV
jgi:polyhydroxyalkanoate synthase